MGNEQVGASRMRVLQTDERVALAGGGVATGSIGESEDSVRCVPPGMPHEVPAATVQATACVHRWRVAEQPVDSSYPAICRYCDAETTFPVIYVHSWIEENEKEKGL